MAQTEKAPVDPLLLARLGLLRGAEVLEGSYRYHAVEAVETVGIQFLPVHQAHIQALPPAGLGLRRGERQAHAAPAAVYQTERYGRDFSYVYPVPNAGRYLVRLGLDRLAARARAKLDGHAAAVARGRLGGRPRKAP